MINNPDRLSNEQFRDTFLHSVSPARVHNYLEDSLNNVIYVFFLS